jgi:hypothetical protein
MTGKAQFDDEFEAFLHGQDELSRHLRALAQPEPPAELDAAILARAEAELTHSAANDPAMPGVAGSTHPGFMRRWRAPLAMAASVLCAFLLLMRWQAQPGNPAPMVVAQAARPHPSAPAEAQRTAPMPPAAQSSTRAETSDTFDGKTLAAKPHKAKRAETGTSPSETQIASVPDADAATPPLQIALADTQEPALRAAPPAPAPAASAASVLPPVMAVMPAHPAATEANPSNPEKAKAWVALIDELLKADLRQDALAEWGRFRKVYPQYPVPGKLEARIKALQK